MLNRSAIHFVDHSTDDSPLGRQVVVFDFWFLFGTTENFNENRVDFIPVTLVWKMSGAFDDSYE
jgi:hypothetical protein